MSESAEPNGEAMRVDPARAKVLVENLQYVAQKVDAVRGSRNVRPADLAQVSGADT